MSGLRELSFDVLDGKSEERVAARRLVNGGLIVVTLLSVLGAVLWSDPSIAEQYGATFGTLGLLVWLMFTVEYAVRLWCAPLNPRWRTLSPGRARMAYAVSIIGVIDLISCLPFWVVAITDLPDELMLLLQSARVLKLLRYSGAFEIFGSIFYHERHALLSSLIIMISLLVLVSGVMHVIERAAQPEQFGTVARSMWWGIVTLATVGYGDSVPITPLGKIVGGVVVIMGIAMFALPAGIIASGFVEETRRRSFVVTWTLVASVPFFQNLPAVRIAQIADVLRPRTVGKGEVIVEQGEPGDCMYFIVSGEVRVMIPPRPVRLESGDFFGEIALVTDAPRSATVIASSFCQLVALRATDFRSLMAAHDDLRESVRRIAEERLASIAQATDGPAEASAN